MKTQNSNLATIPTATKSMAYNFYLPDYLQRPKPTETRGIPRDEIRLMVSNISNNHIEHTIFRNIGEYLRPDDVLVINTTGTLNTPLKAMTKDGISVKVHLSSKQKDNHWAVALRKATENEIENFHTVHQGEFLALDGGGSVEIIQPYCSKNSHQQHLQLWETKIHIEGDLQNYLDENTTPIFPNYIREQYPQSYYQTVFAKEMGSTQLASGGRGFTASLLTRLIAKGIQVVPVLLHIGGGIENIGKPGPFEEYYQVSEVTANTINKARKAGKRIIAIGTTVVRALETVANKDGFIKSGEGKTNKFITPEQGVYAIDGLVTGLQSPKASHLLLIEALTGRQHLEICYQEGIEQSYQWHKFGDVHLILP